LYNRSEHSLARTLFHRVACRECQLHLMFNSSSFLLPRTLRLAMGICVKFSASSP
jgi:hypothetical protein